MPGAAVLLDSNRRRLRCRAHSGRPTHGIRTSGTETHGLREGSVSPAHRTCPGGRASQQTAATRYAVAGYLFGVFGRGVLSGARASRSTRGMRRVASGRGVLPPTMAARPPARTVGASGSTWNLLGPHKLWARTHSFFRMRCAQRSGGTKAYPGNAPREPKPRRPIPHRGGSASSMRGWGQWFHVEPSRAAGAYAWCLASVGAPAPTGTPFRFSAGTTRGTPISPLLYRIRLRGEPELLPHTRLGTRGRCFPERQGPWPGFTTCASNRLPRNMFHVERCAHMDHLRRWRRLSSHRTGTGPQAGESESTCPF